MNINQVKDLCKMLDLHYSYYQNAKTKRDRDIEHARYIGHLEVMDYTLPESLTLNRDENGKHSITPLEYHGKERKQ